MNSPYRTTAFRGAIYTVGLRWSDRIIGLASTLILARLLTPVDFGLVAMAMIAVGLIDILLDLGVGAALIQNKAADRGDFDTAWTLRLCQAAGATVIVFFGAPWIADYFGDTRVTDIMRVIAITIFVGGLENIGVVLFQKGMEFGREFRFFFAKRTIGAIATVIIALLLRSYWALVIGSLVTRVVGVVLSFVMHSYRPRLSLERTRQIWSFSQWNVVASIFSYLVSRVDQFVIGKRADASVLGAYAVGGEIASMPSTELIAPLGRVMFPAFAMVKDQPSELLRLVLLALSVQALIGIPAGVGVALVASEAVPVLLGGQWRSAIPFVQILGLGGMIASMMNSSNYLLLALGKIRTLAFFQAGNLVLLVSIIVVAFPTLDARGIAMARLAVALVALAVIQSCAAWALPGLRLGSILRNIWRPCLATVVMAVSVSVFGQGSSLQPIGVIFAGKVMVGVFTYVLTVALLWRMAGCPKGGETYLVEKSRLRPGSIGETDERGAGPVSEKDRRK